MRLHQVNINDVTAAVSVDHPWSPADCVLVLGTNKENKACFAVDQIPALVAVIQQCGNWVAKNDPLRARLPAYDPHKPKG